MAHNAAVHIYINSEHYQFPATPAHGNSSTIHVANNRWHSGSLEIELEKMYLQCGYPVYDQLGARITGMGDTTNYRNTSRLRILFFSMSTIDTSTNLNQTN